MVHCLAAEILFNRADRRDEVLADLQTRVASKPRWGVTQLEASVGEFGGQPAILLEARFTSGLDQEELRQRIDERLTGPRAPLAGSWYTLHECAHDERNAADCGGVTRRAW